MAEYFQNNEAVGCHPTRQYLSFGTGLALLPDSRGVPKRGSVEWVVQFFHGITVKTILNLDFVSHSVATWAHFEIYLQDFVNDFEIYQGLKLKIKMKFPDSVIH